MLRCSTGQDERGRCNALRYLVEPVKLAGSSAYDWRYKRVVIAGHSLGSQIAFDAINRLTHKICQEDIDGFDVEGDLIDAEGNRMPIYLSDNILIENASQLLCGLQTFGSPLDKIAFFLREQVEESEDLRQQMLANFHCFKQKNWNRGIREQYKLTSDMALIFEDICWENYHDKWDFVSGRLDYYEKVKNIDVDEFKKYNDEFDKSRSRWDRFKHWISRPFDAHVCYWDNKGMFNRLATNFLCPRQPLKHE